VVSFVYYQWQGLRKHGAGYIKQFIGPMLLLAPIMLPIELISHIARMLSLTVRLFANMFAGDLVTLVFFSLVPVGIPVLFMGLHIFVSFLQAYIFVLLVTVYLAGAVSEAH
jgi:F-type H+-transporting ATPase subunit a